MLSVNLLVLFASLLVCAHAATVSESDSDSGKIIKIDLKILFFSVK